MLTTTPGRSKSFNLQSAIYNPKSCGGGYCPEKDRGEANNKASASVAGPFRLPRAGRPW